MTAWILTALGAALAVGLELLEALAIVLAVGSARGWRDAALGAVGAIALLALAGVLVGPVLLAGLPVAVLEVVIGTALLLFGLEWLRKGVLRLAGRRSPSSALREYLEEREALEAVPRPAPGRPDWAARVVAGKGVALEGLEVVLIVAALGAGEGHLAPALAGAGCAVLAVLAVGAAPHRPLARLPESHLKYGVGVVLSAFGVVFLAEGAGVEWPGGDLALLYVAGALVLASQAHRRPARAPGCGLMRALRKLVLGETWTLPAGVAVVVAVALALDALAGGWWEQAGGFVVLALVLGALSAALRVRR